MRMHDDASIKEIRASKAYEGRKKEVRFIQHFGSVLLSPCYTGVRGSKQDQERLPKPPMHSGPIFSLVGIRIHLGKL